MAKMKIIIDNNKDWSMFELESTLDSKDSGCALDICRKLYNIQWNRLLKMDKKFAQAYKNGKIKKRH